MKSNHQSNFGPASLIVSALLLGTAAVLSAPAEKTAAGTPANARAVDTMSQSVFVSPTNSTSGRDPFFPRSERPWKGLMRTAPVSTGPVVVTPAAAEVVYMAFSGSAETTCIATVTVNGIGRTLKVGEYTEVISRGVTVKVRCISITEEKVVIEVDGERKEIALRTK